MSLLAKWKAPMQVAHGGKDFRVLETQCLGLPSQFLDFPDENQWVLKPANSIHWHETVLAWLDSWTWG